MSWWHLKFAARILAAGGVVAYPTEGVYGLGCDPQNPSAVLRVLALKARPTEKGLIVIAADRAQLSGYVCPDVEMERQMEESWPGPVTWLLPAGPAAGPWLTGGSPLLATRVSAHPIAAGLCREFGGPLVSTSANLSGRRPARSALAVRKAFGTSVDYLLPGRTGGQRGPSEIRDGRSGRVIRAGPARR